MVQQPRRPVSFLLLGYVLWATWQLTAHFIAVGDGLSTIVDRVVRTWPIPLPRETASGIDFIECFGCDPLPGGEGYALGIAFVFVAGGPLALIAWTLQRFASAALATSSAWLQAGFILQAASLCLGVPVVGGYLFFATPADFVHWAPVCALLDVALGAPALLTWRRLQARAFVAPRPRLVSA